MKTHTTSPGESIMGIALRELNDEGRWAEIRDLNDEKFPDMTPHCYYPPNTTINMPEGENHEA
ncbi:MAG: hypothetical protein HRT93_03270 [Piscirickettsiaceae bacterium]|nr:hypothetical protein [Piscirickettsiaceae bacterium]